MSHSQPAIRQSTLHQPNTLDLNYKKSKNCLRFVVVCCGLVPIHLSSYQRWFCVWAQSMRDDVTMRRRVSLAVLIPRIPEFFLNWHQINRMATPLPVTQWWNYGLKRPHISTKFITWIQQNKTQQNQGHVLYIKHNLSWHIMINTSTTLTYPYDHNRENLPWAAHRINVFPASAYHKWGMLYQKQVSGTGTCNYTTQKMWDVIVCPCLSGTTLLDYIVMLP